MLMNDLYYFPQTKTFGQKTQTPSFKTAIEIFFKVF